ncbi:cytochrome c oxidase subunit 4 [Amycolatopsis taiwanensis]|uniref:Cytochrome c oxidase polypeptide 4 n=1 Tax=Amycolatopsis taiwanensis TaxID=342230 RepID=A0A9W6QY54_9PSEU|nr:cytochrome c oxidase subunit 4 [Amycolatopsis taiwanensis]GLY66169.1 cytochrome c oxidase polypeptide 4 [Amycolatopsis taiwanensis]
MKVEARIFDLVTGFCLIVAVIYGVTTAKFSGFGIEPIGVVALGLTGGLSLIAGSYIRFVSRRIEPRPEDREDAEVSDGAGEMGFFSPGSYWPIGMAAAVATCGIALAFFHIWLIVVAGVLILITVGGLVFEYHTGPNHE